MREKSFAPGVHDLDKDISMDEIPQAVSNCNLGKAYGVDELPMECIVNTPSL